MELYVLSDNFRTEYVIDTFLSLIWTERYTSAGDTKIVLPLNPFYVDSFKPGKFLGIPDSNEIMVVENQLIENGLLKISGQSLITILNQRYVWEPDVSGNDPTNPPMSYVLDQFTPGYFIAGVVNRFAVLLPEYPGTAHDMNEVQEKIPNFSITEWDNSGTAEELTAALGPIYDAVKPIAEMYQVGMSLYLASTNPLSLKFKTYKGKDRTSNQTINDLIRLSPSTDDLSDVKELRSNVEEINNIYVWAGVEMRRYEIVNGVMVQEGPPSPGLHRRTAVLHPAVTPELFRPGHGIYKDYMFPKMGNAWQTAKYYLTQRKQLHIVDAQVTALTNYKFGIDYRLGDVIEYESIMGTIANARITEYIRSHDSQGERAYPTIVIE
jgi:hypothetical protein